MNMTTNSIPPAAGEAAHTPTPWQLARSMMAGDICILSADAKNVIAVCGQFPDSKIQECAANAAFIVTACNERAALTASHADLVANLEATSKALLSAMDRLESARMRADAATYAPAYHAARAVLTLAKEAHP